jgi:hypothetical protein
MHNRRQDHYRISPEYTLDTTQKAQRQRIKEASAYARATLATPEVRLEYEQLANEQNKRLWDVALTDYFKDINQHSTVSALQVTCCDRLLPIL